MTISPEAIEKAKQRRLQKLAAEDKKAGLVPRHPGDGMQPGRDAVQDSAVTRQEFDGLAQAVHEQHLLIESLIVLMRLSGGFDNNDVRRVFKLVDAFDASIGPKSGFKSNMEWVEARYWWIVDQLGENE